MYIQIMYTSVEAQLVEQVTLNHRVGDRVPHNPHFLFLSHAHIKSALFKLLV